MSASMQEKALAMGLLQTEYDAICDNLKREPSLTELSVFAGMWSEHCSYKSTLHWLKTMPNKGEYTLAGPGSHAGVVKVSDTWAVAFKIESHNHPSAVEPYQGAATGVGGILRDIIAQGARPVAIMDSLCFGIPSLEAPEHGDASRWQRFNYLKNGVADGIAGYGNAIGVANVGGCTVYDPRFEGNPLVNALAAGLQKVDASRTAAASGLGNLLLYVGARTGRDGILGAAFASEDLSDDTEAERPHVQVGDPFAGKQVMEACLSFNENKGMIAGQDMGAAGITCACFEMAAAGGVGIDVALDTIPTREEGMVAQEIMLSESQERFMFVIAADKKEEALAHFRSYGVQAEVCGTVVSGDRVRVTYQGKVVVDLPADLVADGTPPSNWPVADTLETPAPYPAWPAPDLEEVGKRFEALLQDPNIASKEDIFGRYDQTVGNGTVRGPEGADAALVLIPPEGDTPVHKQHVQSAFGLALASRPDLCAIDPYLGSKALLAECMRALAASGADMRAITDGLNVASPRNPVENLKLKRVIDGLADGLRELEVPVTGGNCSLYNESSMGPIPPSPMVGALGVIANVAKAPKRGFEAGLHLWLLHPEKIATHAHGSRIAAKVFPEHVGGDLPLVDLALEKSQAQAVRQLCDKGIIRSAKMMGQGGLLVALAKSCVAADMGAKVDLSLLAGGDEHLGWLLFGEHPGTYLVGIAGSDESTLSALIPQSRRTKLGETGGGALNITLPEGTLEFSLARLNELYRGGLG